MNNLMGVIWLVFSVIIIILDLTEIATDTDVAFWAAMIIANVYFANDD